MSFRTLLVAAALALALPGLAGCGFKPMYAPAARGEAFIGSVQVDQIPGKTGHELKAALDRRFSVERGRGAPSRLTIALNETTAGLNYQIDEAAQRKDLYLTANYAFIDPQGVELFRGVASVVSSYDVPASAYGDVAAQNAARTRAADFLADKIRSEIAAQFAREAQIPGPTTP